MNPPTFRVRCCICGQLIEQNEEDAYSLLVQKYGSDPSPETVWAHGPCLREVMPVLNIEPPGPQGLV
jgi:hypothetical protein